ncbi:MAG TPA: monofunctional biosynthetic peptidoglycan transglycosylase [Sphingomonas sp.]|nr:monofunctional biosynthetic peptidoglycan transglycosylase [Sphingomonas sp.]
MIGRWVRRIARAALLLALIPLVLTIVYNIVPPVSTLMLARWATLRPVARDWVALDRVSPVLVRAVLASEDARFCQHMGVDLVELNNVIDESDGLDAPRGASTITMQLAKNLFLWNGRSVIRKGLEFPLALYINFVMSKRRQMEIYLNIAEWGPNGEFGVEAASRRAFGKGAGELSARQAALLAVMLPNPHQRDAAKPGAGLSRLAARLLGRIPKEGGELTSCLGLGN